MNLYTTPQVNPNGRETSTARGAEGARAWGDLFVPNTPDEVAQFDRPNLVLNQSNETRTRLGPGKGNSTRDPARTRP